MAYKSYLLFERRELEANGQACQQRADFALNFLKILLCYTLRNLLRERSELEANNFVHYPKMSLLHFKGRGVLKTKLAVRAKQAKSHRLSIEVQSYIVTYLTNALKNILYRRTCSASEAS